MLAVLLSGTSSCSLWNPHIGVTMAERDEINYRMKFACPIVGDDGKLSDKKVEAISPYCDFYGSLPSAIEYAETLRQRYYDAVGDQSKLKNGLALALIPMGAAAVAMGIGGGSTDVILGLAAGGAAALGVGTFFSSEPREKVYLSGSQALGCAIVKTFPYLVQKERWTSLDSAGTEIPGLQAKLQTAISDAETFLLEDNVADLTPLFATRLNAAIGDAKAALAESFTTTSGWDVYKQKVQGASLQLYQTVDEIRDKVSVEVLKTEPGIPQIQGLIAGLPAQIHGLTSIATPQAETASGHAQSESTDTGTQAQAALQHLVKLTIDIRTKTNELKPTLDRVTELEQDIAKLPACAVTPAEQSLMSIVPDTNAIELAVNGTFTFQVANAFGHVSARLNGAGAADGLLITATPSGATQSVTIVGKKAGDYSVLISDDSNKGSKAIAVKVK